MVNIKKYIAVACALCMAVPALYLAPAKKAGAETVAELGGENTTYEIGGKGCVAAVYGDKISVSFSFSAGEMFAAGILENGGFVAAGCTDYLAGSLEMIGCTVPPVTVSASETSLTLDAEYHSGSSYSVIVPTGNVKIEDINYSGIKTISGAEESYILDTSILTDEQKAKVKYCVVEVVSEPGSMGIFSPAIQSYTNLDDTSSYKIEDSKCNNEQAVDIMLGGAGSYYNDTVFGNNILLVIKDVDFTKNYMVTDTLGKSTVKSVRWLETEEIYAPHSIYLAKDTYTYTGSEIKPDIKAVYDVKGNVVDNSNYTVTYEDNINAGTGKVKVSFQNNYSGLLEQNFTINEIPSNPAATSISKVKAVKKGFKVSWKKAAGEATGYEIQYSTKKNFKTGAKTVKVASAQAGSKTIKKLSSKKKYYVRIRVCNEINGETYYSDWSAAKNVKTK